MHCEDLKDGRSFAEVASRVSKKKPVIVLKAGRTALGARAASSHTGALAGNDKIYDDVLRQSGVIRAPGLRDMLEYARGLQKLPTPKGENVVIITGAGGSGVLLSDACVDNGLDRSCGCRPISIRRSANSSRPSARPAIPSTSPAASRRPPIRTRSAWGSRTSASTRSSSAIGTPSSRRPWCSRTLVVEVVEEMKAKGIDKPIVASLAGDVQVEEAAEYLYDHGIPSYAYSTEIPVAVLGAKYKWARGAGLIR